MGFDKLLNFLNYNLNSEIMEEINIKSNTRKILVNHVMFDISFIIYQTLIEIEDEINTIIKIILSLPFSVYSTGVIDSKIKKIYSQPNWLKSHNYLQFEFFRKFWSQVQYKYYLPRLVLQLFRPTHQ